MFVKETFVILLHFQTLIKIQNNNHTSLNLVIKKINNCLKKQAKTIHAKQYLDDIKRILNKYKFQKNGKLLRQSIQSIKKNESFNNNFNKLIQKYHPVIVCRNCFSVYQLINQEVKQIEFDQKKERLQIKKLQRDKDYDKNNKTIEYLQNRIKNKNIWVESSQQSFNLSFQSESQELQISLQSNDQYKKKLDRKVISNSFFNKFLGIPYIDPLTYSISCQEKVIKVKQNSFRCINKQNTNPLIPQLKLSNLVFTKKIKLKRNNFIKQVQNCRIFDQIFDNIDLDYNQQEQLQDKELIQMKDTIHNSQMSKAHYANKINQNKKQKSGEQLGDVTPHVAKFLNIQKLRQNQKNKTVIEQIKTEKLNSLTSLFYQITNQFHQRLLPSYMLNTPKASLIDGLHAHSDSLYKPTMDFQALCDQLLIKVPKIIEEMKITVKVKVYKESTVVPYIVLIGKQYNPVRNKRVFILAHDFFDCMFYRLRLYQRLIDNEPNTMLLVFNYPGQFYTIFDPLISYNNQIISQILDSILYDLDTNQQINLKIDCLRFIGFGLGGNVLLCFLLNSLPMKDCMYDILLVNAFLEVDDQFLYVFDQLSKVCDQYSDFHEFNKNFIIMYSLLTHTAQDKQKMKTINKKSLMKYRITREGAISMLKGIRENISLKSRIKDIKLNMKCIQSDTNLLMKKSQIKEIIDLRINDSEYLENLKIVEGGYDLQNLYHEEMTKEITVFMSKNYFSNKYQKIEIFKFINNKITAVLKFLQDEMYESIEKWFRSYVFLLNSLYKSIQIQTFKKILGQLESLSNKFYDISVEKTELIQYLSDTNDRKANYEIEMINVIKLIEDKIRRKFTDINLYIDKYELIIEKRIKLCNYLNQILQFRELIKRLFGPDIIQLFNSKEVNKDKDFFNEFQYTIKNMFIKIKSIINELKDDFDEQIFKKIVVKLQNCMIINIWEIHNILTITMKQFNKFLLFVDLNELKNRIYKVQMIIESSKIDRKRMSNDQVGIDEIQLVHFITQNNMIQDI